MPLKIRVIPTLLLSGDVLVIGKNFNNRISVGSAITAVKVYNQRLVDELIIIDIHATNEHRCPNFQLIEQLAQECFIPLTIGGGIRSLDDIYNLLNAGADKVCLNSILFQDINFLTQSACRFGSQCIVASVDVDRVSTQNVLCYSHSGRVKENYQLIDWIKKLELHGAGEILLTSINKDGTMEGYDVDIIRSVMEVVKIPVIASGGAGHYEHMYNVIKEGGASAVAAASMFQFTKQTPLQAKYYLHTKGIPVRLNETWEANESIEKVLQRWI